MNIYIKALYCLIFTVCYTLYQPKITITNILVISNNNISTRNSKEFKNAVKSSITSSPNFNKAKMPAKNQNKSKLNSIITQTQNYEYALSTDRYSPKLSKNVIK